MTFPHGRDVLYHRIREFSAPRTTTQKWAGGLKMATKGTADGTVKCGGYDDAYEKSRGQRRPCQSSGAAAAAAFLHRKCVSFQKFEES